jgi:O-antigen/teichoic acid export membrane protein
MDRRRYFVHVAVMASGTAAAQAINFFSYPFLTRTYSPHDFGVFTIFLTIASIVGTVSCGRFDVVIQAAPHESRFAVFATSQVVNLATSLALAIVAVSAAVLGVAGPLSPSMALWLGPYVFLVGFCMAGATFLLKHEAYVENSLALGMRALTAAACQIALFFAFPNATGLIAGFCAGYGIQLAYVALKIAKITKWRHVSPKRISYVLRKYGPLVSIDIPSQVISALTFNSFSLAIFTLYSTSDVGFYSMAYRIAGIPLALFASSLSDVFFQKVAASFRATGSLWKELKFNIVSSSILSVAIFIPLAIIVRPFVDNYLGEKWGKAADILIFISPYLAVRFVAVATSSTALIIGKPKWLLTSNTALLIAISAATVFAFEEHLPLREYLLLTSTVMSVIYVTFITYLAIRVRGSFNAANPKIARR